MNENKRLLAVHQGALGDVITSFPALLLLRKSGFQVDLACRGSIGSLARILGVIERSHDWESALFSAVYSDTFENRPELSRFLSAYDILVIFSFSDALYKNFKILKAGQTFRVYPRPEPSKRVRVHEHIIAALKNAGLLKKGFDKLRSGLFQDLRNSGLDRKRIILHPGSGSPLKNWPLKNFAKLHRILSEDGFRPVFLLGPAEEAIEKKLEELRADFQLDNGIFADKPLRDSPTEASIPDTGDNDGIRPPDVLKVTELTALADILKSSGGYIGNDSGVTHLAAWLGNPTVAIFGPTDHSRWKPAGRRVKTVASEPDCSPCFETKMNRCKNPVCLSRISPAEVRDAFLKFKS